MENIKGKKFNHLTVLEWDEAGKKWQCQCECGKTKLVRTSDLKRNHVKSCGCKFRGKDIQNTHNSRIYNIWYGMIKRCTDIKNKDYKNYGAKGIKVCSEWQENYTNFYNWSILNGYQDNLTLDRIDNFSGYEPNNCRWADMSQQHRNYSQNRNYTINNETKCLTEWCKKYKINYTTALARIKKGKKILEALTIPVNSEKIPKKYRKE